ncbi:hypothetical protein [Microbulbifer sp. ARAS458-1]|uniref:hypothetical protein n=1 Tax=Microbulbifer sp. ARAS458-1 TaxID=3140242 RepID=UPI003877E30E
MHLKKTLDYLENAHGLKVARTVNGKGWGVGYLMNGEIPFQEIIREKQLEGGVTVSTEHGLISCAACWENIAEYARYNGNWA